VKVNDGQDKHDATVPCNTVLSSIQELNMPTVTCTRMKWVISWSREVSVRCSCWHYQ